LKITVILCTFNRCQLLARALESVLAAAVPSSDGCPDECEFLVVDNNSSDATREVVELVRQRYPGRLRYLFEPRQGLSHARNAGIREAQGEVLIFVDDDVTVDPRWLEHLADPFRNPACSAAGGRILPDWSSAPPGWLPIHECYALAPFAAFDLGLEPGPLGEPPFGANMAFRKAMFDRYGTFRTDLGRCGTGMMSNEDTEFGRRLLAGGELLLYAPSSVVYHPVSQERLQKKYLLRWWYGKGRADTREFGADPDARFFLKGVPIVSFRRLARWLVQWMVTLNRARRFSAKLKVYNKLGEVVECYQMARGKHAV
jgi:glycosyltransferase involved in cell wall biosynthesis